MSITQDIERRELFLSTLSWLLAVVERYSDQFNFALVKIAYGDDNELGDAYGAADATVRLAEVTQALQSIFRKTDLIARNGSDVWILFPYTPFSENIYLKIREVIDSANHDALHIVNRKIAIFTSPFKEKIPANSALAALDHLNKHQDPLADHSFILLKDEQQHAAWGETLDKSHLPPDNNHHNSSSTKGKPPRFQVECRSFLRSQKLTAD